MSGENTAALCVTTYGQERPQRVARLTRANEEVVAIIHMLPSTMDECKKELERIVECLSKLSANGTRVQFFLAFEKEFVKLMTDIRNDDYTNEDGETLKQIRVDRLTSLHMKIAKKAEALGTMKECLADDVLCCIVKKSPFQGGGQCDENAKPLRARLEQINKEISEKTLELGAVKGELAAKALSISETQASIGKLQAMEQRKEFVADQLSKSALDARKKQLETTRNKSCGFQGWSFGWTTQDARAVRVAQESETLSREYVAENLKPLVEKVNKYKQEHQTSHARQRTLNARERDLDTWLADLRKKKEEVEKKLKIQEDESLRIANQFPGMSSAEITKLKDSFARLPAVLADVNIGVGWMSLVEEHMDFMLRTIAEVKNLLSKNRLGVLPSVLTFLPPAVEAPAAHPPPAVEAPAAHPRPALEAPAAKKQRVS